MPYTAPVRDLAFALAQAADVHRLDAVMPGLDAAMIEAVLSGAAQRPAFVLRHAQDEGY